MDGWGVQLLDKTNTNAVISKVCTYINNKPIVSMNWMLFDSKVTTLDLSNFDTSNVINMANMFQFSQVTALDLSSFDTSNVTEMGGMFGSISKLKTIYASNKFVTTNVTDNYSVFKYSYNLVGGSGTKYDNSKVDKTYAHIDGGTSNPGYFTDVADKNIPAPNSFSTDSWKTIIKAVKDNNTSKYNVGDTKTVSVGSFGTHTLRIANKSTPSSCNTTGSSQTSCGFVLEFADIINNRILKKVGSYTDPQYMSGDTIGGWPVTDMRTYINNDIYNGLPTDLKSGIINTSVVSSHSSSDSANFTTTDKLYLLAPKEIYSDWSNSYDSAKDTTRQLDYYKNKNVTTSNYSATVKSNSDGAFWWWLRNVASNNSVNAYYVDGSGSCDVYVPGMQGGVSPAFRIG